MTDTKKLPVIESNVKVKVTFDFPNKTIVVKDVGLGRAKTTCMAMCKKYDFEEQE